VSICDFCLAPDPPWTYPAAPMELDSAIFDASVDDFAVCDDCHQLIAAGDVAGLTLRIVQLQQVHVPPGTVIDGGLVTYPPQLIALERAKFNVLRFMDARTGPPTR
jgi:hypothetical protein